MHPTHRIIETDTQSWWLTEALTAESGKALATPALKGRVECDVAVVGGGFAGLWSAFCLKQLRPNIRVVLIEADICGAGASGKNGGKCHGYWYALGSLIPIFGIDKALELARMASRAQSEIAAFATAPGRDVWWRESGNLRVSTVPAHDVRITAHQTLADELGIPDTMYPLSKEELSAICDSPAFRGGAYFPEGATVQPARLCRALRDELIGLGVTIYEQTPMIGLDQETPTRLRTPEGEVVAGEVVLATNTALVEHRALAPYLALTSSYAVMTESAEATLEKIRWTGQQAFSDMHFFLSYFRRTPDGRVLMGSGSGPIGFGARASSSNLRMDANAAFRAVQSLDWLLPDFRNVGIAGRWGGAIDLSGDRYPFFGTFPGTRVHYLAGFSGHGVNATYMAGRSIASVILNLKDDWYSLPFYNREPVKMPPEPLRYIGAKAARWGILQVERSKKENRKPGYLPRFLANLPQVFGIKLGF